MRQSLIFFLASCSILLSIFNFFELDLPKLKLPSDTKNNSKDIQDIARGIYEKCNGQQTNCYEEFTRKELLDIYSTSEVLSALYDFDTYFSCHAFTHFIGRALYIKIGNIPDAYSQVDFTCHGGAYHGAMEAYLDQRKTDIGKISGDEFRQICNDSKRLTNKNPKQVYVECLHGLGHAFMFITDANLPISLKYCDLLNNVKEKEPCYGGVFMENSTSSTNANHPSKWIKKDDKFYPCTILSPKYLNQCYFYQANYLIKESVHDYEKVFADCHELKGSHRDNCLLGLGANLAGFSRQAGIAGSAKICSLASGNAAELCVEGAVPSFSARYGGEGGKLIEFCQNVDSGLMELCYVKLGQLIKEWPQNEGKIETICLLAGNFRDACLGYSKVNPHY